LPVFGLFLGAFAFLYGVILLSLVALYFELKESKLARTFSYLVLLGAAVTFGLTARTASLGGKIRHTKL
jgi:hypothetical protein